MLTAIPKRWFSWALAKKPSALRRSFLPENMPLSVKVFIIWLAVILWKRESDAAVTAGST
jgi:hypothetical protein